MIHLDNDVVSLTRVDVQSRGSVWNNRSVISANDSHLMVIEVNHVRSLGRAVDDAEEMLLARFDSPGGGFTRVAINCLVLAVEHVVNSCRERASETGNVPCHLEDSLGENLVDHDGTHVIVVVSSGRSVNDNRSSNTTTVLRQGVRVVPTGSIRRSEPSVGADAQGSNSALSDTWNTVLVVCASLADTVPVNSGRVVSQQVCHGNLNPITPVDFEKRTRCFTIDQEGRSVNAIEILRARSNGEGELLSVATLVVVHGITSDRLAFAPQATAVGGVGTAISLRKAGESGRWSAGSG